MEDEIRFCPKCKSEDVRSEISFTIIFGGPQNWICNNCGFRNIEFPIKTKLKKNVSLKKKRK